MIFDIFAALKLNNLFDLQKFVLLSFWFDLPKTQNLVPLVNVVYKYNAGLPNLVLLAYFDNSFLSNNDCGSI